MARQCLTQKLRAHNFDADGGEERRESPRPACRHLIRGVRPRRSPVERSGRRSAFSRFPDEDVKSLHLPTDRYLRPLVVLVPVGRARDLLYAAAVSPEREPRWSHIRPSKSIRTRSPSSVETSRWTPVGGALLRTETRSWRTATAASRSPSCPHRRCPPYRRVRRSLGRHSGGYYFRAHARRRFGRSCRLTTTHRRR